MSVKPVARKTGNKRAYKVRYKDHAGNDHAETYNVKADAQHRDAAIKQAKQRREPIPKRGRGDAGETFETFAHESWWPEHVVGARLSAKTQERYATFLDKHLIPRIGDEPIAFIDVPRVLEVKAGLAADDVPDYTSARTLKLLRQVLTFAVISGRLTHNPADVLRSRGMLPPQNRKGDIRPIWPEETEAIRAAMLKRKGSAYALRDATLISVLGYAGLRPHEAIDQLSWEGVASDELRIYSSKTKRWRSVPELIRPLVDDLERWREKAKDTSPKALVFPAADGKGWSKDTYGSWRSKVFKPCAPEGTTPYGLRHGYASSLIREGVDLAEVAERLGNSPMMTAQHYAHVSRQYRNKPSEPMEAVVLKARA
jgi:site-specific recombinase XerD